MKKITPNPPHLDLTKLHQAAERALDYHLPPVDKPFGEKPPVHLFTLHPDIGTETLLVQACETLASLNVMTTDLAFELTGAHRQRALASQQMVVLGELLLNRMLDNFNVDVDELSAP